MLKKRLVATLVVKDGIVVQSRNFARFLPVGKPAISIEFLDDWGVDEIILLDISASKRRLGPDYSMVRNSTDRCRVPLTVGGGITSLDHIHKLMDCGADKISLNQSALYQPALLTDAAKIFGSQCVVASIDAVRIHANYFVYDYLKCEALPVSPAKVACQFEGLGAGEILINSVDRDGRQCGFDLTLVGSVCAAVTVPVICCGGAGKPMHFTEVLVGTQASAAAAANFFHFTEHSVITTKALLSRHIPVRHESYARYEGNTFDCDGRLIKKPDSELEELLFQRFEKEVI